MSRLSLAFQRATIDLTVVSPLLSSIISTLEKMKQELAASFQSKVDKLITKDVMEPRQSSSREEEDPDSECEQLEERFESDIP